MDGRTINLDLTFTDLGSLNQLTGTSKDPWAEANRPAVEQDKPAAEQGTYLHPEVYGRTDEMGAEWVRNPKMMKKVRESRQAAKQAPR